MNTINKLLFCCLIFCGLAQSAYSQSTFTIFGIVRDKHEKADIRLTSYNGEFSDLISEVKDGTFRITGIFSGDPFVKVYLSVSADKERIGGWDFFIQGGEMQVEILHIAGENLPNSIRFTNIPFLQEQKKYNEFVKPISDSLSRTFTFMRYRNGAKPDNYNKDSLEVTIEDLEAEQRKRNSQFVQLYPTSYFALLIFQENIANQIRISPDTLLEIFSVFDSSLRQSALGKTVASYLHKRKMLSIGNLMPDFEFSTVERNRYKLSSFRNENLVLLCFWNSGCAPCIKSIPTFKKIASEYTSKGLQLISISTDNDEKIWQRSVNKYSMPWLQTRDSATFSEQASISSLFDIFYFPQYFLIDKQGKAIYHNVQLNDDDNYSILQKLLKEQLN